MIKISEEKRFFYLQINKLRIINTMRCLSLVAWYLTRLMASNKIVPSTVP